MRLLSYIILLLSASVSSCQSKDFTLSVSDYNYILSKIDTTVELSNYHILVTDGYNENTKTLTVWINNRLGSSMLLDSGFSICEFFEYNQGRVFVYDKKKCWVDVPAGYINELGNDPYSYLEKSPMHVEGGFELRLLIERQDEVILIWKTELINEEILRVDDF